MATTIEVKIPVECGEQEEARLQHSLHWRQSVRIQRSCSLSALMRNAAMMMIFGETMTDWQCICYLLCVYFGNCQVEKQQCNGGTRMSDRHGKRKNLTSSISSVCVSESLIPSLLGDGDGGGARERLSADEINVEICF